MSSGRMLLFNKSAFLLQSGYSYCKMLHICFQCRNHAHKRTKGDFNIPHIFTNNIHALNHELKHILSDHLTLKILKSMVNIPKPMVNIPKSFLDHHRKIINCCLFFCHNTTSIIYSSRDRQYHKIFRKIYKTFYWTQIIINHGFKILHILSLLFYHLPIFGKFSCRTLCNKKMVYEFLLRPPLETFGDIRHNRYRCPLNLIFETAIMG